MFNKIKYLFIFFLVFYCFTNITFAVLGTGVPETCGNSGKCDLRDAFDRGSKDETGFLISKTAKEAGYDPGKDQEIEPIIGAVVQSALSFLGVIFLILMIYGGYLWMTAQGNEEQVTKAKNLITAAVIGIVIVVSAYAISYFVISKMTEGALTQ